MKFRNVILKKYALSSYLSHLMFYYLKKNVVFIIKGRWKIRAGKKKEAMRVFDYRTQPILWIIGKTLKIGSIF